MQSRAFVKNFNLKAYTEKCICENLQAQPIKNRAFVKT